MTIRQHMISAILAISAWNTMALPQQNSASFETKYSQLPFRETPFADIKGIFPLTEAQAQNRKHYVLRHDGLGRVTEMKFVLNENVVALNINKNVVTHAPHIKIQYTDNKEIRSFFDQFNKPTLSNGAYREVFELDDNGQRKSLYFLNEQDQRVSNNWDIFEYKWEIDKRGTVVEQRFNQRGQPAEIRPGFPFFCIKLHYDQRGYLAMMENYGLDCQSLTQNTMNAAQDKLIYNAQGFMTAWNVYDGNEQRAKGNGPNVATGIMEHDAFGNTTREYYLDELGNQMHNAYGWFDSIATYDQHGNMVSRFNTDEERKYTTIERLGYAGYIISYDEEGKFRTSISYYDQNKAPTTHKLRGYHQAKNHYQNGQISRIEFLDINQKLTNRSDNGIAYIKFDYVNGKTVRTSFDENGQKMK